MGHTKRLAIVGCAAAVLVSACEGDWVQRLSGCGPHKSCNEVPEPEQVGPPPPPEDHAFPPPMGLPAMTSPESNPINREKVELGRLLFSDARLAQDSGASCETCHLEHLGWADGARFAFKVGGAVNTRHTPTLYNIGYERAWYWDGRASVLEDQIVATLKGQMGTTKAKLIEVANYPEYEEAILRAFGRRPWADAIPMAIAAYLRTLRSGDSRWDRAQAGDANALSADEQAGWKLFSGKAGCYLCHVPPLFSNGGYHDLGLERGKLRRDPGRAAVTGQPGDLYAFRTPTLRAISRSAPYFHDGSADTLEQAVRFMLSGGLPPGGQPAGQMPPAEPEAVDGVFKRIELTDQEVSQLVAFLMVL